MEKEQSGKTLFRGELALVIAVLVNSFGVVLMLYSGAGISAISSVPYAFSLAFPALTLGTWTYLFQGTLIASQPDDYAPQMGVAVPVQLCSGLCVQ